MDRGRKVQGLIKSLSTPEGRMQHIAAEEEANPPAVNVQGTSSSTPPLVKVEIVEARSLLLSQGCSKLTRTDPQLVLNRSYNNSHKLLLTRSQTDCKSVPLRPWFDFKPIQTGVNTLPKWSQSCFKLTAYRLQSSAIRFQVCWEPEPKPIPTMIKALHRCFREVSTCLQRFPHEFSNRFV